MSQAVPGRIGSIVNIHNPSVEFHTVDRGINTGAVVILVAGGGHNTLNVGSESADFVPFFYNYGVNTVILRNRLRKDGYDAPPTPSPTRSRRSGWCAPTRRSSASTRTRSGSWASRPAPSCRRRRRCSTTTSTPSTPTPPIRWPASRRGRTSSASSIRARRRSRGTASAPAIPEGRAAGVHRQRRLGRSRPRHLGDGLLRARCSQLGVPNIEMHLYGNGRHPGDRSPDGSRQSGGLTDRSDIPLGTWQARFVDWFRDLGFLQKPGVETKAAQGRGGLRQGAAAAGRTAQRPRRARQRRRAAELRQLPRSPPTARPQIGIGRWEFLGSWELVVGS